MFRQLFIAVVTAAALAGTAFNACAAVDVNRATQAELESVKGIGPGLSGKILEARKAGEFKSWADLVDRVAGVGPGNAARMSQNGLTVGGAAFDGPAPTRQAKPVSSGATAADKAKP